MIQFHETQMGKMFFQGTMPQLVNNLEDFNGFLKDLFQEIKPKQIARQIATASNIASYLDEGWKPILVFSDAGEDFIIVEREVRHE